MKEVWHCLLCGEPQESAFRACWNCGARPDGSPGIDIKKESPQRTEIFEKVTRLSAKNALIVLGVSIAFLIYFGWRNSPMVCYLACLMAIAYSSIHIFAAFLHQRIVKLRKRHDSDTI